MIVTIPSALHICPRCEELCTGELYCEGCREASGRPGWNCLRPLCAGLLFELWGVAMFYALRYIWLHLR